VPCNFVASQIALEYKLIASANKQCFSFIFHNNILEFLEHNMVHGGVQIFVQATKFFCIKTLLILLHISKYEFEGYSYL